MMIDKGIEDLRAMMHATNDAIEEKVESFDEEAVEKTAAEERVDVMEEDDEDDDDFDGWNAELKDSRDNGSGLVAEPTDAPIAEPRKTLMELLKGAAVGGDLNPALQVTVSVAPIFQIDRPYKLKYNNISDQEFREMFWASHEHEVTAICVDYNSGGLSFITGYHTFLDGIKTKSFTLTVKDIDKYDIRFTPYCTYAEAVAEYKLTEAKEEKEK